MQTTRWKIGDRVGFHMNFDDENPEFVYGTVRDVLERVGADTLYSIKWDDGFEDGADNMIAEWELNDLEEIDEN
jgi:hypothetical protein